MKNTVLFWVYLTLAIAGLVTAWVFNYQAVMNGEDYGRAWTATAVDLVATYDLGIVAVAGVLFMFAESSRISRFRFHQATGNPLASCSGNKLIQNRFDLVGV